MIDKVHEWMDVDGTKANLVSDHIHHDETSPHAQIFAVPVGDERDLPGDVTERKLSLKNLLVGHSSTRSEAQHRYSERHDEMRDHINEVARAHGIDYVATMERVDSQRSNLSKVQLRRHKAEQLRQRVHDMRVADNVVEAGDRLKGLADREAAVTAREEALDEREAAVSTRETVIDDAEKRATKLIATAEAEAPEIRRRARSAGEKEAEAVRADADDYAVKTKGAADQGPQKAQIDAQRRRQESDELVAEAERERQAAAADREAAARQRARAATALTEAERKRQAAATDRETVAQQRARAATTLAEAEEVLASVKSVPGFDPAVLDGDTRDAMKQVDADFLDRLCERSPKIAEMRKNAHGSLWSKNQAQRDLANRSVEENRRRARQLRQDLGGPQTGREGGSGPERHRGLSGPQAGF